MQHKALWFYIQAQVHTHASDRREVGTKDVIATSASPGVLPTAGSWSSIKEPPRSRLLVTGRAMRPSQRWQGPGKCTVVSLSSFLPQKMRARSGPSLSLPSPNSCFSEMQKTIWTQHPDSLVSQLLSPIVSKTPLLL